MIKKEGYDSYYLLAMQVLAHAGFIWQIFYGSIHAWLITVVVYFITSCFGMTMTYHRLLSHKSWNAPRWFEIFGTLCATYGLTGSSIGWVAIHREHHHYPDNEKDPHSPSYKGFFKVQWLSMFEKPNPKYAMHLIRDPFHSWIHRMYFIINICILTVLWTFSPWLCVSAYLAPAALLWNAGSFINTLTHMIGYRNHDTSDDSTNIWWLGYFMWGEGWHNNHHNTPSNSRFGEKWWEIDIGHFFIRLVKKWYD
jgi:stearoyl-CoA desaturase (delta-9 desaturase)